MYNDAMMNFKEKSLNFVKKNKNYFLVFVVLFAVFSLMLAINNAWPFGSNTILISDSYIQIVTFFEHVFGWFSGKNGLFYSSWLGGGVELFSTLQYMLINPFYLIVFFGGIKNIHIMMQVSVFLMMVFNSFVMLWFINKRFETLDNFYKILISIAFAFTSFASLNFAFVTWMIYPGITLLLIDAFLELVNNKKIWRFALILAWFVVNCFSMGISNNIILVVLFFGYILFMVPKENKKEVSVRLFLGYVVGALISVAVLLPSLIALLQTNRTSSFVSSLLAYEPSNTFYLNLVPLFLTLGLFAFSVAYLILSNKKTQEFKFNLFAFILVLLPSLFPAIKMALAGGQMFNLPYRYCFLAEVFMFVLSIKFLQTKTEQAENSNSLFKILTILFASLTVGVLIFVEILSFNLVSAQIKAIQGQNSAFVVSVLLLAMIAVTLIISLCARKSKMISQKLVKIANIVILCVTLVFNTCTFIGPSWCDTDDKSAIVEMVNNQKLDGKIKLDMRQKSKLLQNTTLWNVASNNVFTSLVSTKTVNAFDTLGMKTTSVDVNTAFGDLIADSMLGHKYYLTVEQQERPYYKLIASEKCDDVTYYLYENKLATTGAFVVDDEFAYDSKLSYFENIERLKNLHGISGELYTDVNLSKTVIDEFDKNFIKKAETYSFTPAVDGILYINHIDSELNSSFNYFDEFLKDENNLYFGGSAEQNIWNDVAFVKAGETYEFNYIKVADDSQKSVAEPKFKFLNYDTAEKLCTELKSRQADFVSTKNGFKINLSGIQGKLVVFNVNIDGLDVSLDGKQITAHTEFNGFVSVDVTSENKVIEAEYNYPYVWIWVIVILICAGLIFGLLLWYKKTSMKKLEKTIFVFFNVISCCILSVFYLLCLVLTIFKIIL